MSITQKLSLVMFLLKQKLKGVQKIGFVNNKDNFIFIFRGECVTCHKPQKIEITIDKEGFKQTEGAEVYNQIYKALKEVDGFIPECGFLCDTCELDFYVNILEDKKSWGIF